MSNFFGQAGIQIQDLISGFVGGVARCLMPPYISAWNAVTTILLGALTAAYMTDPAAQMMGLIGFNPAKLNRPAVGFIVGITAMTICQGIIAAVAKAKFPGGRKNVP